MSGAALITEASWGIGAAAARTFAYAACPAGRVLHHHSGGAPQGAGHTHGYQLLGSTEGDCRATLFLAYDARLCFMTSRALVVEGGAMASVSIE